MNNFIIAFMLATLAGCTVVPVKQPFPDVPKELLEEAEPLTPLTGDKRELSDLIDNATDNYSKYYELVIKYEGWQLWYNEQKKVSDKLNSNSNK